MGKKRREALRLEPRQWERLASDQDALQALLDTDGRAIDVLTGLTAALQAPGELHSAAPTTKLAVLGMLDQHAGELCGDAPEPLLRGLYEAIRDRSAAPSDGPEGAARLQLAGLHTLTTMLVALDMPQRDARLTKVHVEHLFRIMERSGRHATTPPSPELCRCAAACLRRMEEAAPTLLLAGSKQLLDLARAETSGAAEAYVTLAASVLSHGAARCLDLKPKSSGSSEADEEEQCGGDAVSDALRALSSIDARARREGSGPKQASAATNVPGARDTSPAGMLEEAAVAAVFASGRSASAEGSGRESEGCCQSPDEPGSPRGVASIIGTLSTLNSSAYSAHALSAAAQDAAAPGSLRTIGLGQRIAASDVSGSVQLDGSAAQPLLAQPGGAGASSGGHGLRHFMVPSHIHWPDALGHAALAVYLTPQAHADLRQAAAELIAAMPKLGVEGVAALTAALPPILRLADLPGEELEAALEALLRSGKTLLLQAVLKLYSEVPEGMAAWRHRLCDAVLRMVNGPHPAEQRVIAVTWTMVQHHSQLHNRQPSLFAGGWRHLLPRADDPAHLLSLKVKALSACLAVGIGRADEICPLIFSWDGFWQARPSDQQLRLATYALRMLASAAASYAALPPEQVARCRRCASMSSGVASHGAAQRPAATPHYVKACLVSSTMQLLATRPQYLPAVDAFLANCAGQSPQFHAAVLNAADALFSAAAAAGDFWQLAPRPRAGLAIRRRRSEAAAAPAAPVGAAAEDGSPDTPGSPTPSGVSGMLRRMKLSMSKRFASSSSPETSPDERSGSLQQTADQTAGPSGSRRLDAIPEASIAAIAAPQPPLPLASWQEVEAWIWDSRTWAGISTSMLHHDPLAYRPLLLRLAQSGTEVLPLGALRLLASYASQYQGEAPSHLLPAKEAGAAVLAICQAAAMTHLLIGPAGTAATAAPAGAGTANIGAAAAAAAQGGSSRPKGGSVRGRARMRPFTGASSDGSSARDSSPAGLPGGCDMPQWTLQQEEIARGLQAVMSALTSRFPSDSVRRRAQSFLDLLANPAAWDLKVRMSTVAKILRSHISAAVGADHYL